ncbi:hypothetical protein JVU11DRAFT_2347 [Chiua virens]|nr:hypothetical protein JVU11DRAFT_2347 [Chiua virens]
MLSFNTPRFRIFRRRKNPPFKSTHNELKRLVHTADRAVRRAFNAEMQTFSNLHSHYLAEKDSRRDLCVLPTRLLSVLMSAVREWEKIQTPDADQIIPMISFQRRSIQPHYPN